MNDKPFFDTNVILYAFRQDDTRSQVAETLLVTGGALSVQVLNEFVAVARRKLDKSWEEVRRALDILRVFCPEPVPLTVEIHERAVDIADRYGYSIFDSLVIAAAIHNGCHHTLFGRHARWPGDRGAYDSQSVFALGKRALRALAGRPRGTFRNHTFLTKVERAVSRRPSDLPERRFGMTTRGYTGRSTKIFVTGSAGHLGEAVTLPLHSHEAVGRDRKRSHFTQRVGSIADHDFVEECLAGMNVVVHTATLHKPHVKTHPRQEFVDTNITGTSNLLEAAVAAM